MLESLPDSHKMLNEIKNWFKTSWNERSPQKSAVKIRTFTALRETAAMYQSKLDVEFAIHTLRTCFRGKKNVTMLSIDTKKDSGILNTELAGQKINCSGLNVIENFVFKAIASFLNHKLMHTTEKTTRDSLAISLHGISGSPPYKKLRNHRKS